MILTAIFLLGAGLLAMVWLQDRAAQRMAQERKDWQQERAGLLQRIQAPEVAVIEHNQTVQAPPTVQHALSDEAAAEAEERARVIAEMERLENEALR